LVLANGASPKFPDTKGIHKKGVFGFRTVEDARQITELKITAVLQDKSGKIVVAGHTDNIPIRTGRFRSNWELSSARAVTVLHAMLRNPNIEEERVQVEGHADTNPLVDNDTPENRAKNRRVELIVIKGDAEDQEIIETINAE
ncbi:MAG: OmpA family protein, partial [Gammaproteobacteria bacterium]